MKIDFLRLEIQNFKSVGHKVIFDYTRLNGLTFVYGKNYDIPGSKNGTGKSTIMCDALTFALYGRTMKNTNNKYLPNRFVDPSIRPSCKLFFRSDDILYSVESFGKIVAGEMTTVGMELLRLNDDFSVQEDITQSTTAKTKQYVQENLIGCSFDVFMSSIIVSATDFRNFYEGMGKDQKRKYVENVLSLQNFGEMFRMAKTDLNDLKKEITATRREILKLSDNVNSLQKQYDDYDEEQLQRKISLEEKLSDAGREKVVLEKRLSEFSEDNKSEIDAEIKNLSLQEKKVSDALHKLDKAKTKNEIELKHANESLDSAGSMCDGLCKKCAEIISGRMDVPKIEETIRKCNEQLSLISEKISSATKMKENLDEKITLLNDKMENQSFNEKERNSITSRLTLVENDLKHISSELKRITTNRDNPFGEILEKNRKDYDLTTKRLDEMTQQEKVLSIIKETCSENGVKKFVLKDIVAVLNSQIQKYLNEIGCEFFVCFDETFDFRFVTTSGECEFSSFSAGERQRIQMATMLAFRDLIMSWKIESNIFIIDEMIDANVDTICIENVMNILKKKVGETNQNVFVISHRSELADNESIWDNIVKVSKERGESTFVIK